MAAQVGDRTECSETLIRAQNKTKMEQVLIISGHVQNAHPLTETPARVKKKEEQENEKKNSENFQECNRIDCFINADLLFLFYQGFGMNRLKRSQMIIFPDDSRSAPIP